MASVARLNDDVQINKFNITTWTGDFGVNYNGFPKGMYMDGSYVTQMDETPTDYPSIIDTDDEDHFNPQRLNMSGPMYLKEASVNPAPYRMFPARKFEYADGTVTWDRPGRPRIHNMEQEFDNKTLVIIFIIIVLLIIFRSKLKVLKL